MAEPGYCCSPSSKMCEASSHPAVADYTLTRAGHAVGEEWCRLVLTGILVVAVQSKEVPDNGVVPEQEQPAVEAW